MLSMFSGPKEMNQPFFLSFFFCLKDIVNVERGNCDALNRNNAERIKKDVNDFIYRIPETVLWIKTLNATINALISIIYLKTKINMRTN